jgi:hypothetical protein
MMAQQPLTDDQVRELKQVHDLYKLHNRWMIPQNEPAAVLLSNAGKMIFSLSSQSQRIDDLENDMGVIQDAIATGFWNIEHIWEHIKTDEGDELARDVQQLWLELMWADFIRSSAHDHWDGFTFRKPEPPQSVRFFDGDARKALEELP